MLRRISVPALLLLIPALAAAQFSDEIEIQAQKMEKKIMAPCCWAGPLDGHYSGLAETMKASIRQQLAAGVSERDIIEGFVAQHGDQVRAQPKAAGFDTLVWILPPLLLVAGVVFAFLLMRHWMRNSIVEDPALAAPNRDPNAWPSDDEVRRYIEKEIAAL